MRGGGCRGEGVRRGGRGRLGRTRRGPPRAIQPRAQEAPDVDAGSQGAVPRVPRGDRRAGVEGIAVEDLGVHDPTRRRRAHRRLDAHARGELPPEVPQGPGEARDTATARRVRRSVRRVPQRAKGDGDGGDGFRAWSSSSSSTRPAVGGARAALPTPRAGERDGRALPPPRDRRERAGRGDGDDGRRRGVDVRRDVWEQFDWERFDWERFGWERSRREGRARSVHRAATDRPRSAHRAATDRAVSLAARPPPPARRKGGGGGGG
mmetsp:Transcript_5340/g.21868  ORF Transcript_5340/g.21868 Transcript_5340/m.21868 type:complete len:264 (+) Transcript_5340:378-1169(+)